VVEAAAALDPEDTVSLEQKRQHWFDADDNEVYASELRTAAAVYIAALEAELAAMDKRRATAYGLLDSAEAELAALKGRRCGTCASGESQGDIIQLVLCRAVGRFSATNTLVAPFTHSCSWWTAREAAP